MCVRFWDIFTGCGHEFPGALSPCADWAAYFNIPFQHERVMSRSHAGRCRFCQKMDAEQDKKPSKASSTKSSKSSKSSKTSKTSKSSKRRSTANAR